MKYFTPLLALGGMRHSQESSKSSNSSSLTRSPPCPLAMHFSQSPSITQPCLGGSCFLKLCQPLSVLPSKSSFQPAAFSAAVTALGAEPPAISAAPACPKSARHENATSRLATDSVIFMESFFV